MASKYGNKRTEVDGYKFDSQAEARRYSELKLMERAGEIKALRVHPKWHLHCPILTDPDDIAEMCRYIADFSYVDNRTNHVVVEDVKGARTAMYRLKKKWLRAEYGIEIQEIEA